MRLLVRPLQVMAVRQDRFLMPTVGWSAFPRAQSSRRTEEFQTSTPPRASKRSRAPNARAHRHRHLGTQRRCSVEQPPVIDLRTPSLRRRGHTVTQPVQALRCSDVALVSELIERRAPLGSRGPLQVTVGGAAATRRSFGQPPGAA